MTRLNLGCGYNKQQGWTNVDHSPACQPDQVVELESFPWPWGDSSVDEILLRHVLEHLGATPAVYIGVIKEIWRVCRDGAKVTVVVPHPRHDDFLSDPTHVRPITAAGLALFSRRANEEWRRIGAANTPLALYHGVDFEIVNVEMRLDEPWSTQLAKRAIDEATVAQDALRYNNVVKEQEFVLRVIKP